MDEQPASPPNDETSAPSASDDAAPGTDPPSPSNEADGSDGEAHGAPRWRAAGLRPRDLGIGAAVLVALLLVGFLVTKAFGIEEDDDEGTVELASEPTDDFDRPSNAETVGAAANGSSWVAEAGIWGLDSLQVYLAVPQVDGGRNLLTLDMGTGDGTVQATFARVRGGTGLMFRYQDPTDFWMVAPAPTFGTWVVQHVVDGEAVVNANVGLADAPDGSKVRVELDGPTITVVVNDAEPLVLRDESGRDATRVGFTAQGFGSNEARWDDLYAVPA